MLSNLLNLILIRCPHVSRKVILVPFAVLGILGFIINTHLQLIPSNSSICRPKTNIVFLKTHKCAGSSVQNILMRYGYSHNLNFVLPRSGNYLGHPALFNRSMVGRPLSPWFTFHMLAHHTRLNYPEIKAVMPLDSVYITIVRDPKDVFESSYSYYNFDKLFRCDIHKFIENLTYFSQAFHSKRVQGRFGLNQMFFDLGGNPAIFNNEDLVLEYINHLESWFDLVLVAERMDESLILLKHLMCWDLDDVVTFKLNARNPKFKSSLSDYESKLLQQFNHADKLLYDRFVKKLDDQINAFGRERMAAEVSELRKLTQNWYQLCVMGEIPVAKPTATPKHYINLRVLKFEVKKDVSNSTCSALTMEELVFTDHLRDRQMSKYPSSFQPIKITSKYTRKRIIKRISKKL